MSLLEKAPPLCRRHPRVPELLPAIPEKLEKFRAFASGRRKTVVEAIPFVGNFLSAYELYTGTNWWTGEPLSPAERILAALGTVPGVGQMERLAGQSSIDLVKWALNSVKGRYVLKASDLRSTLNDINDFLTGATMDAIGFTLVSDTEKQAMSALDDAIRTGLTSLRAT